MSKFKEITRERKIQKIDENLGASCLKVSSPLQSRYPIIDNIFLSYWWNIMPLHFCEKKKKKKEREREKNMTSCKRSYYVRGSKSKNPTK
jgi:hypothetical protein